MNNLYRRASRSSCFKIAEDLRTLRLKSETIECSLSREVFCFVEAVATSASRRDNATNHFNTKISILHSIQNHKLQNSGEGFNKRSPQRPNQPSICMPCSILDGDLASLPRLDGLQRSHEHLVQPQCVCPVRVHDIIRVDHVPSRLAHLFPISAENHPLRYVRPRYFPFRIRRDGTNHNRYTNPSILLHRL